MNRCLSLLALLSLFWSACYESDLPMASADHSTIDPGIVGKWSDLDGDLQLTVFKFNEREYFASWVEDQDQFYARAYIVDAGGERILNVQNIADLEVDERDFVFFRYRLGGQGQLVVSMVDGDSPLLEDRRFESSEELREFFEANARRDDLYLDAIRFRRR